jgi:hypothetical protein
MFYPLSLVGRKNFLRQVSSQVIYSKLIAMGFKTFLTLATLGLAAATESSVVSLFLIGNENPQPLVGSIVAVVRFD